MLQRFTLVGVTVVTAGVLLSAQANWQDVVRNLRHPDPQIRLKSTQQLGGAGYVEAAEPVPWTRPQDIVWDGGPLPRFGDSSKDSFLVLLGNASVRSIPRSMKETTLRNAITPADGQVLGPDW